MVLTKWSLVSCNIVWGKRGTFKQLTLFVFIMSSGRLPTIYQREACQLLLSLIEVQPPFVSVGILQEIDKIIELGHHSQSQQSSTPRRANKSSSQLWARENAHNQVAANCSFLTDVCSVVRDFWRQLQSSVEKINAFITESKATLFVFLAQN